MKKIILLLSILLVITQAKAQVTHHYINSSTMYLDTAGNYICWADGNSKGGSYKISQGLITFDMGKASRKVYSIVSCGKWEPYDEGYTFKEIKVCELAGPDQLRFCRLMILRDPAGIITDIVIKYPDKEISYRTRPYKPNEYGYKLEHSADASIKRD